VFVTPYPANLPPERVALRLGRFAGLAWLDGGLAHGREGRFSFVGALPSAVVARPFDAEAPLSALDALAVPTTANAHADQHGLSAGDVPAWIGHVAYDAHGLARAHGTKAPASALPCVHFARYPALYVYDHERERAFLAGDDARACGELERMLREPELTAADLRYRGGPVRAPDLDAHAANVAQALEQIRAGEVYEVNLASLYRAPFAGSALGLFLRMRALSPVPLGYFAQGEHYAILGRSMERFLRLRADDRALWTSPIKGTIAHAGDATREAEALLADPKEHAEHAMVVDLMRNDLSRVSEPGSVRVRELMCVQPFAGLSHLVSTVEARALPGLALSRRAASPAPPSARRWSSSRRSNPIDAACTRGRSASSTARAGYRWRSPSARPRSKAMRQRTGPEAAS
jgi:para-aminobenzoate synthetase component 1